MYFEEDDEKQLLQDFKAKIKKGETPYYDSVQMEIILEELFLQMDQKYIPHAVALAIQLFPKNMIFHLYKVKEHILKYELDKAEEKLSDIEQKFPPCSDIYMERIALTHLQNPSLDISPLIKKALKLDPNNEDLRIMLCLEYCKNGTIENAIEQMKILIPNDEFPEEHFADITSYMTIAEMLPNCYKFFQGLTEEFPLHAAVWCYFGVSCTLLEKLEEAIEAFQFSIACDESYTMAHFMLGQAYFIDRQFEKAIKHLSETLEDELYNHSAYRYFGDYGLLCERYDEALRYYRQSLDLSSSEFALCGIIKTLTAMGKSDEAEPFVNQLISETFITPDAFPDVCSILIDKGKRDLIPTIIDRTLTGYTHYRNFFEDLFDFFLTKKEYQLGLDIFEIYLRLMDEHRIADDYYYYCAALNFLLNRIETGITFLHDALLFNFEKHQEFLSWDPSFAENEKIIDLIQKYKN